MRLYSIGQVVRTALISFLVTAALCAMCFIFISPSLTKKSDTNSNEKLTDSEDAYTLNTSEADSLDTVEPPVFEDNLNSYTVSDSVTYTQD